MFNFGRTYCMTPSHDVRVLCRPVAIKNVCIKLKFSVKPFTYTNLI